MALKPEKEETGADEIRDRWRQQLYSTASADRTAAGSGVRDMYRAAGFEPPRYLLWLDSPAEACWAVMMLKASHDQLMRRIVEALEKTRASRQRFEAIRGKLCKMAGVADWQKLAEAAGRPLVRQGADPRRNFEMPLIAARLSIWEDPGRSMGDFVNDALFQAQMALYGLFARSLSSGADTMLMNAVPQAYNFCWMAMDEKAAGGQSPPFLEAAWRVARAAGPWWAFNAVALLTERPAELHRNGTGVPERGDGPAILYRDGWKIYAWNGSALPEKWILQPETIPPGQLKHADKSFRQYIEARVGAAPQKKPSKQSAVLQAKLPSDPAARLEQLRKHAGGKLPLYDRYMAGECREVWRELVALNGAARAEPAAADALAVAYETMRRVRANSQTVIARLQGLGYKFETEGRRRSEREDRVAAALANQPQPSEAGLRSPHVCRSLELMLEMRAKLAEQAEAAKKSPPDDTIRALEPPSAATAKLLGKFEKKAGPLPLSLRAFYEVVGSVDLRGSHPILAPPKGSLCPDPLVVFPVDDVLEWAQEMAGEDDDDIRLQLAPDDVHKAGASGGEPYEIAVPEERADGELLNERHGLPFVDYLRLCFRFGGFPGYEGCDELPPEIEILSAGLLEF